MSLVYCSAQVQGDYWRLLNPGTKAQVQLKRAVPLVYTVPTGLPPAKDTLPVNTQATVQSSGLSVFDSTGGDWLVVVVVGALKIQLVPLAQFDNLDGLYPTGFYAVWGLVLPDRILAFQQV